MFDKLKDTIKAAGEQAQRASNSLALIEPVSPFNHKGMLTALITAAGLISVTLLAGVGLSAMTILLLALGIILMILTKVFGVEFDMAPEDFMKF